MQEIPESVAGDSDAISGRGFDSFLILEAGTRETSVLLPKMATTTESGVSASIEKCGPGRDRTDGRSSMPMEAALPAAPQAQQRGKFSCTILATSTVSQTIATRNPNFEESGTKMSYS